MPCSPGCALGPRRSSNSFAAIKVWPALLAAITAAVAGVVLNLFVWFALYVLFGRVIETHWGLLRWYAFDPLALDVRAAALATIAALLPADCIAG